MSSSERAWTRWDAGAAGILVGMTVLHLAFVLLDGRVVRDPGRFYQELPGLYFSLGSLEGALGALGSSFTGSGGWLNLGLAAWLRLLGRSSWVFGLGLVVWTPLLLGGAWALARRLAGPAGGLAGVAMTAANPLVSLQAREGWIHVPEAAGALWMVWLWGRDPKLSSAGTVAGLGLVGAFLLNLRGSGLLWVGSVALALAWTTRGRPVPRVASVLLCWAVGGVPALLRLGEYVGGKLDSRARYVANQQDFLSDLLTTFSPTGIGVVALGLGVGLGLSIARPSRPRREVLLLLTWPLGALVVFAVMRAGLSNYLPFVPAVTLLAGCGLAWLRPWLAVLPVGLLAVHAWSWSPLPILGPGPLDPETDAMRSAERVWPGWGVDDLGALLDATCPSSDWHSCHVVVTEGLIEPASEDFGWFGLFLMGEDRVELRTVFDFPAGGWARHGVAAVAVYECGASSDQYHRRASTARSRVVSLIHELSLHEVYRSSVNARCGYHWLAPRGRLARPELLPEARGPTEALTVPRLQGLSEDFARRNPQFVSDAARAPLYTRDLLVVDEAPPGWEPAARD